jgi:hypothetical protein
MLSTVSASFELKSLHVTLAVNPDGSAHVDERIDIFLSSPDDVELYNSGMTINDLATWKERIGLGDIRYHMGMAQVDIKNIRIRPQPVERCSTVSGACFSALLFDYDVSSYAVNGTTVEGSGLFTTEKFKPRTTRYTLNSNALSFDVTTDGDIVLQKNFILTIVLPKDAKNVYAQPLPKELLTMTPPFNGAYTFTWENTILPKFEFSYEREESLESEVIQFFQSAQQYVSSVISGPEGLAVIFICLILLASYVYIGKTKKKR